MTDFQLLVTGGPGSGATTTGQAISVALQTPCFDSDGFFHKLTNPPFQEQYSAEERSALLHNRIASSSSWILSGSICAWGITDIVFSHALVLNVGAQVRIDRLKQREQERFGGRIEKDGDMYEEHTGFMHWASNYESGELEGRSLPLERRFLESNCKRVFEVNRELPLPELVNLVQQFLDESIGSDE